MLKQAAKASTFPRTRAVLWQPRCRVVLLWWPTAIVALVACAFLRGSADDVGLPVHGAEIETGSLGFLPTKSFQQSVYPIWPEFFQWTFVSVHASWFVVPWIAALLVSFRKPDRIGSFFRWWIALHAGVVIAFVLFPLEPPWMADREVSRVITVALGSEIQDSNVLAAMPSLHVALPLTLALWFFRERWIAPGVFMAAYSAVVGCEVVFSGEHYVVDVAGAGLAAGTVALVARHDFRSVPLWGITLVRDKVGSRRALPSRLVPVTIRHSEKGQALLEFAFVFPLLFVFVLLIVDFGFAMDRREVVQHAVREGARVGAVGSTTAARNETVKQGGGIFDSIEVCHVDGNDTNTFPGNAGDSVRVTGTYTHNFAMGSGSFLGAVIPDITMTPSAEARLEKQVPVPVAC